MLTADLLAQKRVGIPSPSFDSIPDAFPYNFKAAFSRELQ